MNGLQGYSNSGRIWEQECFDELQRKREKRKSLQVMRGLLETEWFAFFS